MSYVNVVDLPVCQTGQTYNFGRMATCSNFNRYNDGCSQVYATLDDAYPPEMARPGCDLLVGYSNTCMAGSYGVNAWGSYSNNGGGNWGWSKKVGNGGMSYSNGMGGYGMGMGYSNNGWGNNKCSRDGRKKC